MEAEMVLVVGDEGEPWGGEEASGASGAHHASSTRSNAGGTVGGGGSGADHDLPALMNGAMLKAALSGRLDAAPASASCQQHAPSKVHEEQEC